MLQIQEISDSKENQPDVTLDEFIFSGNTTPLASKPLFYTPDLSRHRAFAAELRINSIQVAEIKAHPKSCSRRGVAEEYFYMMTQAVKMNSPYMDVICSIPPRDLYIQMQEENVPFCQVRAT